MNFGLSGRDIDTLAVVRQVAFQALSKYKSDQVVEAGLGLARIVEFIRINRPDQIPKKKIGGGLLGDGKPVEVSVNDFELAESLVNANHPGIAELTSLDVPVLMAYLSVISIRNEMPRSDVIASALHYTVNSLTFKNLGLEAWSERLQADVDRLQPLADTGRKFKRGRPENAVGPLTRAIVRHLNKNPTDNPDQVWAAFKRSPPKGMTLIDSPNPKLGRYIEYDKRTHAGNLKDTSFRAFANIVYRKRKELQHLH